MDTVKVTEDRIRVRHEGGDASWTFRASKSGSAVYSHAWETPESWALSDSEWKAEAIEILRTVVDNVHPIGGEDALRKLSEAVKP